MKLLFDECVPRKVKFLFADGGHECETVRDAGFSGKEHGALLALAEGPFDALVTNLRDEGIEPTLESQDTCDKNRLKSRYSMGLAGHDLNNNWKMG